MPNLLWVDVLVTIDYKGQNCQWQEMDHDSQLQQTDVSNDTITEIHKRRYLASAQCFYHLLLTWIPRLAN